jgi:glycosyltransferase involved in cell wall biosynthesis
MILAAFACPVTAVPHISVFLPTHTHASTLPYAVHSVQRQGVADLEILICGDGATDEVRATVAELQRGDPRIRFFDLPKAPGRGELNRDFVMRQAKGEIVCHQNDDDLWLPRHLQVLEEALTDADFVGAMQVNVDPDDKVRGYYFDLAREEFVGPWLEWEPNRLGAWACDGFGPIFVAHRREAFLRLPEGWITTPVGLPADQAMWHRFIRQPWCRAKFLRWPIALHFGSPERHHWSPEQRADELRRWSEIVERPDYAEWIWRDLLPDFGDRLLRQALDDRRQRQDLRDEHAAARHDVEAAHAAERKAAVARIRKLEAQLAAEREAAVARIRALEAQLATDRDAYAAQTADFGLQFAAEREAAVARIRELEAQLATDRDACAAQTADFRLQFAAEREAAVARIRALEAQLATDRDACAAQTADFRLQFAAEREAAVARIRALEAQLVTEREAIMSPKEIAGSIYRLVRARTFGRSL